MNKVSTAQYRKMIRQLQVARMLGDLAAVAILEGKLAKIVW